MSPDMEVTVKKKREKINWSECLSLCVFSRGDFHLMFTHKGQMASNVKDPTTSTKDKVTSCQFSWVLLFRPVHSFPHWKYEEVTCNTAITTWHGNPGKSFIWRIYGAEMSKAFAGHSSILIDTSVIRFDNGGMVYQRPSFQKSNGKIEKIRWGSYNFIFVSPEDYQSVLKRRPHPGLQSFFCPF